MKHLLLFIILLSSALSACKKHCDNIANVTPNNSAHEPKASGSGGGGGGGGNPTGFIQNVLSGTASRLIGTKTDSIYINFTQPAPAGGWTLQLTSSNASAISVSSTLFLAPGQTNIRAYVTGGSIANAANVTISVKLGAQTKTTNLKVFPLTATFPAPQLQSPGNGSNVKAQILVLFDWNDNNNAYYNDIQMAYDPAFTNLVFNLWVDNSQYPTDGFNGTGWRYWRVRYRDASQNPGPWSVTRSLEVKPN
jgi:hypothetical protein